MDEMMNTIWTNGIVDLYQGDCREVLQSLPAQSVHCVVTSPPYWGLRDYGVGEMEIGLESTPELYVEHLVDVFREVWRVLRDDGTLWLNLGDSYYNYRPGYQAQTKQSLAKHDGAIVEYSGKRGLKQNGLKEKDLVGIPWRVAFALQADGWYLRSDIIWQKPNPMPESVTDRPTKAHEYLFLLTKSATYYYDADAIREPDSGIKGGRQRSAANGTFLYADKDYKTRSVGQGHDGLHKSNSAGRNKRTVWTIATQPMGYEFCLGCNMTYTGTEYRKLSAGSSHRCTTDLGEADKCGGTQWKGLENGRLVCLACEVEYSKSAVDKMPSAARCRRCNRDDAWGSHFATFPEKLVEPCILTGTSVGGVCPKCGAPYERIVEREPMVIKRSCRREEMGKQGQTQSSGTMVSPAKATTQGWRKTCKHLFPEPVPSTVLDPFIGSGTTAVVAQRLGRRCIGIDASETYLKDIAVKRITGVSLPMQMDV